MATRAGVSGNRFFEIFPSIEECYRAAFDEGLERLCRTVDEATARELVWLERIRSGLVALLGFFDDEPSWARLLLLEAPFVGTQALSCEQRLLGVMTRLLENGCPQVPDKLVPQSQMTYELVAGGTFAVIRARALGASSEPLVELAPSLMAFIVTPYLGQAAARAELHGRSSGRGDAPVAESRHTRGQAVSRAARLPIRATHRTMMVLRAIAQSPYSNNREIAQAAGLTDEGQTSKLLARLERQGMIGNVGVGAARGKPNAWLLTAEGNRIVELLAEGLAERGRRRGSRGMRGAA